MACLVPSIGLSAALGAFCSFPQSSPIPGLILNEFWPQLAWGHIISSNCTQNSTAMCLPFHHRLLYQ